MPFRFSFFLALAIGSSVLGCGDGDEHYGHRRRLGSPPTPAAAEEEEAQLDAVDRRLYADEADEGRRTCGAMAPSVDQRFDVARAVKAWKGSGRKLQAVSANNYTVPVYFWHTYAPGTPPEGILTEDFIRSNHFPALQYGYRHTPFKFELKGVAVVESAAYGRCERLQPSEFALKAALRAPGKATLNIYICDTEASDSRFWSSAPVEADIDPLYDGVVLRNYALAPLSKRGNAIQNIVHETGHWFGLLHTFEGGCKPKVFNDIDGIKVSGDDVADTPAHDIPTQDVFPGVDVCWIFNPPLDTCREMGAIGIDGGPDPVSNYMNYLPSQCTQFDGQFTPGQVERMVVQHETFRLDSVCRPADVTCVANGQCCPGLTCTGGNDGKMKCK